MLTKRHILAALAAAALAPRPALAAIQWTAATVRADVARDGAKSVVDRLRDSGQWKAVEDNIKSGAGDWIALTPVLEPGTDAGSSEGLVDALKYALPKNPKAVLAVLDPKDGPMLGASHVCAASFYEGTEASFVRRYRAQAQAAVSKPVPPGLARRQRACLTALRSAGR